MKPSLFLAPLLLLVVPACQGTTVTEEAEQINVGNYAKEVLALPQGDLRIVLFRAIQDAGLPCQGVTSAELIGTDPNRPQWRAQCTDGNYHLVTVDPNGTALVVSRKTP
ncbi:hypothetical protein [Sphingomonas sp.]|jgi:hypothetical protein|uniref:hypothetical protein n=1 Tax=Sphingomonas sp. TaxID=28214 RepID=UPI0026276896|nr:hypothetical protein [Sphingomonas sp.]MDF2493258.1 hypothetical protein [Sphingomonas sp.]